MGVEYATKKKNEDLQAYHAFIQLPFYMIQTLSSGVGVVCIIVILELCHKPHIIVLIIVILYGLGEGGVHNMR